MPSLVTHYLFCKHYSPSEDKRELLGSQGPDPLFYYAYTRPFEENGKKIRKFGTYLHEKDPFTTLSLMLDYLKLEDDKLKQECLMHYILGFAKHYALDRIAHPYIFYKTGFVTKDGENASTFSYYHSLMETYIDVLVADHYQEKIDYKAILDLNDEDLLTISKMYFFISQKLGEKYLEIDTFYQAVKDMRFITNAINSTHKGIRKKIFSTLFNKSIINAMSHPLKKDIPNKDFLNFEKKDTHSCVSDEIINNHNFYELMNDAGTYYVSLHESIEKAYRGDKLSLENIINHVQFDGVKVGDKMKYYSLIF